MIGKMKKSNIKIMFIAHHLMEGGAQKMLTYVINKCSEYYEDVVVLLLYNNEIKTKVSSNVKIEYLENCGKYEERRGSTFFLLGHYFHMVKKIRKVLKRIKPQIVCIFSIQFAFLAYLAKKCLNIKIVVSERRSPNDLPLIWKLTAKYLYPRCNGVVFQLDSVRDMFKSSISGFYDVIPNPIIKTKDDDNVEIKRIKAKNRERCIVSGAARFEYEKGFDVLIDAFRIVHEEYPDYRLKIYGGKGNDEDMFGELLDSLGIREYVEFPGMVSNMMVACQNARLFVLPSRIEGIPNILIEMLSIGMPSVASDCHPGGAKFLIGDNERGLLVPFEDKRLMADSIMTFIKSDELSDYYSEQAITINRYLNENEIGKKWKRTFDRIIYEQ